MRVYVLLVLAGLIAAGCCCKTAPGQCKKLTAPGQIQKETGYNPACGKVKDK